MKHLKKYNEDLTDLDHLNEYEFDKEYIQSCFVELFDEPKKYDILIEEEEEYSYKQYSIGIDIPDLEISKEYDINKFIEISEELTSLYQDLSVMIEKFNMRYPDIKVTITQETFTNHKKGMRFIYIYFKYYYFKK